MRPNFGICQFSFNFNEQIVRHDDSSMHVQGLNAPSECSAI